MKFEYRPYNQHATDDQLIKDLKAVACKLNSASISSKVYDSCGLYSSCTIARRFGSWNHALSLAGLDARNVFHSEEDLFHNIEIVWMKKGKQPTRADMNNKALSVISSGSYLRRFGKWSSAMESFISYVNGEISDSCRTEFRDQGKGRDVNLRLRFLVMKRDHFKCRMCGASPAKDPSVVLHVDHVLPWSRGGRTEIDNLQTLCSNCNLGKSNLIDTDS